MKPLSAMTAILLLLGILAGCTTRKPASTELYSVDINPADFVTGVNNPYFPLVPGTRYVYQGQVEDGLERIEIEVLSETKEVMGVPTTVVHDTGYLNDEMIEDTLDWYAQDKDGNVWYFGEDVKNYRNGKLSNGAGSWQAGVDGALPGIIMFADPAGHIGETYRQEYYKGQAEDMADLLSANESVTVPYGSFENVLKTKDYTPLEPDQLENKFYAPGIGLVKELNPDTGEESVLIEFIKP